MKNVLLVVAVLASTTTFAETSLRSKVISINNQVAKAFMKKDMKMFVKAVKPNVTSDFKHIESGRSMGFDQMVEMMSQSFATVDKMTKVSSKILSLKTKGASGEGQTSHIMMWTMKGEDGKSHKMSYSGVTKDTYVKKNKIWYLSCMEWTKTKTTMDGKEIDMSKMGG